MEKLVTVTKTQKEKHKLKGTWDAQAPKQTKDIVRKVHHKELAIQKQINIPRYTCTKTIETKCIHTLSRKCILLVLFSTMSLHQGEVLGVG